MKQNVHSKVWQEVAVVVQKRKKSKNVLEIDTKKENRTIKIRVKSEGKVTVMSMLKNEEQMSTAVND